MRLEVSVTLWCELIISDSLRKDRIFTFHLHLYTGIEGGQNPLPDFMEGKKFFMITKCPQKKSKET